MNGINKEDDVFGRARVKDTSESVSYTHLRAHET